MFHSKSLVSFLALALAAAAVVNADGFEANRREHAHLNRMIRKRSPAILGADGLGGVIGVGSAPTDVSASVESLSTSSVPASSSTSESASSSVVVTSLSSSSSASASASASESSSSSSASSSESASSSASSSSASSSSSSSLSSSSSSSSSSVASKPTEKPPSQAQTSDDAPAPTQAPDAPAQGSTVHVQITQTMSSAPAATQPPPQNGAISKTKISLTVVGAIAGSIGGAILIWTIIRKWKFKPSAEFEDRMAPIDWQPTDANDGLPGHRRAGSGASSFHSSENLAGRGGAMGYGSTSDNGHGPLPDHDFTAGSGGRLAPVGGYADLNRGPSPGPMARGPSPQPQMQQTNWDNGASVHYQNAQYGAQDAYNYNGPRY